MDMRIMQEGYATGEEIYAITSTIEPLILDFPIDHVIIALLSMAISLQAGPETTMEDISEDVLKTSQYICLLLDTPSGEVIDKSRMN